MDKDTYIYLVIFGMAIVTFIPRVGPILIFSKFKMDKKLERFISYFPVSILTALVVKELFFIGDELVLGFKNPNLLPAIITLIISMKFKSIGVSVVGGIISYMVCGYFF